MSTSMIALLREQASQAALTSVISLACTIVLYTVRPYRESTDNAVSVAGQIIIFCWVQLLLYRVIGVVSGIWAVLCGVALVVSALALFAYATRVIYTDYKKMRMEMNASNEPDRSDTSNEPGSSGAVHLHPPQDIELEIPSSELRRGPSSPQDIELEIQFAPKC